jgi:hypothetical protein
MRCHAHLDGAVQRWQLGGRWLDITPIGERRRSLPVCSACALQDGGAALLGGLLGGWYLGWVLLGEWRDQGRPAAAEAAAAAGAIVVVAATSSWLGLGSGLLRVRVRPRARVRVRVRVRVRARARVRDTTTAAAAARALVRKPRRLCAGRHAPVGAADGVITSGTSGHDQQRAAAGTATATGAGRCGHHHFV